ncbi:MAG: hypothetical protein JWO97_3798 [Acidobacteria bacterium]|nr:hypothetical protein [Acidobacteriota bacterium]
MKRKTQRGNPPAISTTRTRIAFMIVTGLVAGAASAVLLRYLMAVAYAQLMRTNTGPSDWAIAPVIATILALVLFPYRGVKRLPRLPAAAIALIAAIATGFVVRASQPPVAARHVTVLLALCAFAVAIVLKAMWATITFRPPTQREVAAGIGEAVIGIVFSAIGSAVGGAATSSSGDTLTTGGGSFGGGGSSGSW